MSHAAMTKVDFSKSGGGKQEKELIVYRSGFKSFGFVCFSCFQILATLIVMFITIAIIGENILSQLLALCGVGWILFCAFNALRGLYNCLILHEPVVLLQSHGLHYKDSFTVDGMIAWNQIQEMEIMDSGMNKALVITVLVEEEGMPVEKRTHIPTWKVKYDLPQLLAVITEFRNEYVDKPRVEETVSFSQ